MSDERPWRTCDRCNYDLHMCPGCGAPLPHGTEACSDCEAEVRRSQFVLIPGGLQAAALARRRSVSGDMSNHRTVLWVGPSSSKCGACNQNADPHEKAHVMETMEGIGCGSVFTHVAPTHFGTEMAEAVRRLRSDLIFEGLDYPL